MAINPKSLENLNRKGKKKAYNEDKKQRYLSITETGWQGIVATAKQLRCSSVSELLEKIGRGEIDCSQAKIAE